jgi:hypothetical protein
MGPCQHGMTRPRVASGGDALQIWRVSSIYNGEPARGGPPAWGLGEKPTTSLRNKEKPCYDMFHRASNLDRFFGTTWATENGRFIFLGMGTSDGPL